MTWRVETHAHTMWSGDSLTRPQAIVRMCRERQITRIAITDHNTAEGALFMKRMAPGLVIVGEEIMTSEGELLAWFVRESIPAGLTPTATIRILRNQGAVISVSHPFDRLRRGAWRQDQLERIIDKVDAIEVFNARCIYAADNERALAFARQHGMIGSVGSDAHYGPEYGQTLQLMRPFEDDPQDFLDALRSADSHCDPGSHLVHLSSTVAKLLKRAGFRRPRQS
ncbi:MAG: PHP domain-containing protein [Anaerolineaceae bacterium]|nr:PHP domain-containing protein [Anaerolineaceae bacterium]